MITTNIPPSNPWPVKEPLPGSPGDPIPTEFVASKKVDDLSRHESKHDGDPKHDPKHNAREKTAGEAKPPMNPNQGGKPADRNVKK